MQLKVNLFYNKNQFNTITKQNHKLKVSRKGAFG